MKVDQHKKQEKARAVKPSTASAIDADSDGNSSDADQDEEDGPRKRAPRNSKPKVPSAQTLQYYAGSPGWVTTLMTAKNRWRKHVALNNPFPKRELHLKEATAILTDLIGEVIAKGYLLEDRECLSL